MQSAPINVTVETAKLGLRRRLKSCLLGVALLVGLAALGCTQGSYPLDIFYEMHYQQSYKSGEPPRLSAPGSSVAWYPPPNSTSFDDGQHLFAVNCSMCHGNDAKGSASPQGPGPVLNTLMTQYGYEEKAPTDLTLFSPEFVENVVKFTSQPGRLRFFDVPGKDSVMPPFGKLLSPDEIRAIADFIATLPSAAPRQPGAIPTPQPPSPTVSAGERQPPPAAPGKLEIGVNGDALEFDKDKFEVAASTEVVMVFDNVSTINQHNLVIVQAGQKDAVAARGIVAGAGNDWLEPGDPDVITNIRLLNPGESDQVRFTAPPAGVYQFVCTFPGHNFTMFGDFVVNP